jgi:hypothetical protein
MSHQKRPTAAEIGHIKKALDDTLAYTPEGHVFRAKDLPEPIRSVLVNMAALGASFGTKVVLQLKDKSGRYSDEYIVFTQAKYRPRPTKVRRNSRRARA